MYLNKLLLKDFGKFNNKEINLTSGINLIYGDKDSGKSTVKNFVVSMLYGIDKSRNMDGDEGFYDQCKPSDRKGFSGKAYVQNNNSKYLIERSFLRRNRTINVMDVQSGRDVTLDSRESLQGFLFNVDKSTYTNALCIEGTSSKKAKNIAQELENSVDAIVNTGSKNIDKEAILENLKAEKTKYDLKPIMEKLDGVSEKLLPYADAPMELKNVRNEIQTLNEEFATEAARKKREARKLIETEDGEILYKEDDELKRKLDKVAKRESLLDVATSETKEVKKRVTDRAWCIALTALIVILTIAFMVSILHFDRNVRHLFVICTVLFVIVTIVEDLYLKGIFDDDISTPSEEEFKRIIEELEEQVETPEDDAEYEEEDMQFANEYAEKKAVLREREKKALEAVAKKKELDEEYASLELMKDACEKERKAITLAIDTIRGISADINEEYITAINGNTADIVSRITGGKCTDVRYDQDNKLTVCVSGDYIGVSELKSELLYDVDISVKIALARYFCKNRMPVVLDDIINTDNQTKLFDIVECLNTIETDQLIVLSSDEKLAEKLGKLNVSFNQVELA